MSKVIRMPQFAGEEKNNNNQASKQVTMQPISQSIQLFLSEQGSSYMTSFMYLYKHSRE